MGARVVASIKNSWIISSNNFYLYRKMGVLHLRKTLEQPNVLIKNGTTP